MREDEAATTDLPILIQEARQVYETEPVSAALMLHKGIRRLKRQTAAPLDDQGLHRQTASHGENVLRAALWTLDVMGEDAQASIAPTPGEWELNISVAETIVRMMETTSDPG